MSNSPKRSFGSSSKKMRKNVKLDLSTVRQMLPLVEGIARDILQTSTALVKLHPEQESLERHRRELVWAERNRRYAISEEIAEAEKAYKVALHELNELGLALLDKTTARIGFPTSINGRSALFSWQPGEPGVEYWNYEEESDTRRQIPNDWVDGTPIRSTKGSKHND